MARPNRRKHKQKKLKRIRQERAEAARALATSGLAPADLSELHSFEDGTPGGSALLNYADEIRQDLGMINRYGFSATVDSVRMLGVERQMMAIATQSVSEDTRIKAAKAAMTFRSNILNKMIRSIHPPAHARIDLSVPPPPQPDPELDVVDAEVIEYGDESRKDAIFKLLQMEQGDV